MKSASSVSKKYVDRAGAAQADYLDGVKKTSKDPSALAVNQQAAMLSAVTASVNSGRWAANLKAAGKNAWQNGVEKKGAGRYPEGVANSEAKYSTNSGKFDTARASAESLPKGAKGSEANLLRSRTVQVNLRKAKVGA